jgi:hypothetical protein
VSLILEALRKLDREKAGGDKGLLVIGAQTWARPEPRLRARALLLGGLAAALGLAAYLLLRPPAAPAPDAAARPKPVPATASRVAARDAAVGTEVPLPGGPSASPAAVGLASSSPSAQARVAPTPTHAPPSPARSPASTAPPRVEAPPAREPPATPASAAPQLVLQAISRKDGRAFAMINGRTLYEGESFDGFRVVRIGEAEVEVEAAGRRATLRF